MNPERKTLRLGTRASLLAMAQSRQIAARLERLHTGLRVELIPIATTGDRNLTTPLTEVNDPHFFSAQLDQALLDESIDFCVHSYKDLAGSRPQGLQIAALPSRENPADVILFRGDIERLLQTGATLRIGSSSLRRQVNCEDFLATALPQHGQQPVIEFQPLRGGVAERVQRISAMAGQQRLDGVVLALAGLQRLWSDPAGQAAIAGIVEQARWMVLPLSECPTAIGQGALALECRDGDRGTQQILQSLHDPETEQMLSVEQALLDDYLRSAGADAGNSCGVTAIPNQELGYVVRLRGRDPQASQTSQTTVRICRTAHQPVKPAIARPWSASDRQQPHRTPLDIQLPESGVAFVAHWHALEDHQPGSRTRYWTSGTNSWRHLAEQDVWVEGCTDHLGFATLRAFLNCSVLRLPPLGEWSALTHIDAVASWQDSGVGNVFASYRSTATEQAIDTGDPIATSTHFYWLSPQQFRSMQHLLPPAAHHACGPGKTLAALRAAGLEDIATFPSHKDWQQWLS